MKMQTPEELDPRLKAMLEAYRRTQRRDPAEAARRRAKFMAELDLLPLDQPQPMRSQPAGLAPLNTLKENLAMSFLKRSVLATLVVMIVAFVFLFGSAGITAFASGASLPGDALYSLKTSFESARAGLASNPAAQARLHLDFAGRRLAEIESLIVQGRYADISQATAKFQASIQKALAAVQVLAQQDPAAAAQLNLEIGNTLASYSNTLTGLLASVPADVQPNILSAIDASGAQSSSSEDANTNDGANTNDDDDGNTNDDDGNTNDDDGNTNDDDDGNTNDDDDGNTNDDDDGNSNDDDDGNSNDDDDGNSNDDDDGNSNDGGDDNDNDGGDNDNDGGDNDNDGGDNDNDGGDDNDNSGGDDSDDSPSATSGLVTSIAAVFQWAW